MRKRGPAAGRRGEQGAAAVEFALVMLPLLYLVFGIIQYGLYFYSMQAGTSAVSDAVRRLSVGDCQTTSVLQGYLSTGLGAATSATATALTPSVTYTTSAGDAVAAPGQVGGMVTLRLSYPAMNMHFPMIPLPDGGMVTRTANARIEDVNASPGGCA